jgi:1-deoxyxylulose-5-phosphate synthase
MQTTRLGRTGLEVSRICLGCMSFGDTSLGDRPWALDEAEARPIFRAAWEAGINFYDTANVYSKGTSEEITGKLLKELGPRDSYVLATKVHGEMRPGPNGRGQSRKAIMSEIDHSLKRLGHDYVDLYQIHRFDPNTPIEETLEALHDVVKAGKARYIGASSMHAWQFMKMLKTQEAHGWTRFVSMQNHVNLLYREEEREMLPLCASEGIGVIPWSPLARGRLARPWGEATKRVETDAFGKTLYKNEEEDHAIVDRVAALAKARGLTMAQVGLGWLLSKPMITAPILGVTKLDQLKDAVGAVDVTLSPEEIASLEAPRDRVELGVFLGADGVEQLELGLEEVDVAFLVAEQFLEQMHAHIVAQGLAEFARGFVGLAGVVFTGEVGLEHFLDGLADAERCNPLQVRMAFEEDDALDELVGVMHLFDGFGALLGGKLLHTPIGEQAEMHPVLVHRTELEEQRLVKPLDDLCFAFHGMLLFCAPGWPPPQA